MFTIAPPPRSIIDGADSFDRCHTAVTLISIASRKRSSGSLGDGHRFADAGVVDQHVDPAEVIERRRDEMLAGSIVGDVRGDGERTGQLRGEPFETIEPAGGHDHLGTDGVEDSGEVRAEAGRRTGHDGDAAVEAEAIERVAVGEGCGIGHRMTVRGPRDRVSIETVP